MNQLSQSVPEPKPMIFIVSFSRASFSYTTPLMIIATEYIHASVMKRGRDRFKTRRKLDVNKKTEQKVKWLLMMQVQLVICIYILNSDGPEGVD